MTTKVERGDVFLFTGQGVNSMTRYRVFRVSGNEEALVRAEGAEQDEWISTRTLGGGLPWKKLEREEK